MSSYITEVCPNCGGRAYADGVDVGVGYYYEPLHCDCGWCEKCGENDIEKCKGCGMYEKCFMLELTEHLRIDLCKQVCPECNSKNIGIDNWNMFEGEKDYFYYCKECDCTFGNTIK